MFDQTIRVTWLNSQMWPAVRDKFGFQSLPAQGMFVPGFPSSGARGRSSKIKPAEINFQWTGNVNEPFMVSIHPNYWDKPRNIVAAVAFACGKATRGARWGAARVGLSKEDDGSITATPKTETMIAEILADIGDPPAGYGMAFPVREVQRARLRRYICDDVCGTFPNGKHPIIRAATDDLDVTCNYCSGKYHAG